MEDGREPPVADDDADDFEECKRDGSCTVAFVLETNLVVGAYGPTVKSWR